MIDINRSMVDIKSFEPLLRTEYEAEMALLQADFRAACYWDAPIYYPPPEGIHMVEGMPPTIVGAGPKIYHYIYYRPEISDAIKDMLQLPRGTAERHRAIGSILGYFCPAYLDDPICNGWGGVGLTVKFVVPRRHAEDRIFKVGLMYQRIDTERISLERAHAMRDQVAAILDSAMPGTTILKSVQLYYSQNEAR